MRLVQLSDLHFGTEQAEVVEALVAALHHLQPDLLLLSGDITQRARREQFRACQRFLARLPAVPLLAVPGNHDLPLLNLWRRLFSPYGHYLDSFGQPLAPSFEAEGLLVIGVNTTRPRRHVDGCLLPAVVERVAAQLARSRAEVKIVMGHHPVAALLAKDVVNIAAGAEQAVRSWSAAGMQLYLGGHIHYPFLARLAQHYPGMAPDCWTFQAGTAVSRRLRDHLANSFNLIDWQREAKRLQLERWDHQPTRAAFVRAERYQLPLRGWVSAGA